MSNSLISELANIHPSATIADNVKIGPWTMIGPEVEIGEGTEIGPHVVIKQDTKIGKQNKIFQYSSIGEDPQHLEYKGEKTYLEIGDNNVIREFCTINRGIPSEAGVTRIGHRNFIMAYVHIAHDCQIGNDIVFVNNATLAGHVIVNDFARIGGYVGVHQRCSIGSYSFTTAAMIGKDVPPFVIVTGNTANVYGINTVGLKRRGFSTEIIAGIRRAYKIIYNSGLNVSQALKELEEMVETCPPVQLFIDSINTSTRGILK